jgi:hypothetical protein
VSFHQYTWDDGWDHKLMECERTLADRPYELVCDIIATENNDEDEEFILGLRAVRECRPGLIVLDCVYKVLEVFDYTIVLSDRELSSLELAAHVPFWVGEPLEPEPEPGVGVLAGEFRAVSGLPQGGMRYQANFEPQAWQNDDAIPVDPQGPTTWDCSEYIGQQGDLFLNRLHRHLADNGVFLDRDDVLKGDPVAPEWIREWQGPFTITVAAIEA